MKRAALAMMIAICALLSGCGFLELPVWSAAPVATGPADSAEAGEAPGVAVGGLYAAQVREFLSLYVSPACSAESIAKLKPGTLLRVLGLDGRFAFVQETSMGARGYVLSDYLVLAREDPGQSAAAEKTGLHVVLGREPVGLSGTPSEAAKSADRLAPGTRVEVLSRSGDYARVKVIGNGKKGYVPAVRLTPVSGGVTAAPRGTGEPGAGGPEPGVYRVACEEYLTMRSAPSPDAKPLGRVKNGAEVTVGGFDGPFASVKDSAGHKGYLLSGYLVPVKQDSFLKGLDIVKPVENYTYGQMVKDLGRLAARYPGKLSLESAGKSLAGRDIPAAVLGDPGAARHILVHAGIHAREHMTSLLVMAQLEYCLKYGGAPYIDGTVGDWLDGVCVHVLPMANPDGVTISQKAVLTDALKTIWQRDRKRGNTDLKPADYLKQWKANGAGVDINRNFPTGWEALETEDGPSSSRYRGAAPADQPETKALMDYTRRYAFGATISYHATGSCLYWQYGAKEPVNALSRDLARALNACTQYTPKGAEGLDAGGYKDWAMDELGIPSVTVEIGSRPCPLPLDEFHTVWERNRNVFAAAARWVKGN